MVSEGCKSGLGAYEKNLGKLNANESVNNMNGTGVYEVNSTPKMVEGKVVLDQVPDINSSSEGDLLNTQIRFGKYYVDVVRCVHLKNTYLRSHSFISSGKENVSVLSLKPSVNVSSRTFLLRYPRLLISIVFFFFSRFNRTKKCFERRNCQGHGRPFCWYGIKSYITLTKTLLRIQS